MTLVGEPVAARPGTAAGTVSPVPDGTTPLFVLLMLAVLSTTTTVCFALHNAAGPERLPLAATTAVGIAALLGLTGLTYAAIPGRMIRRHRLRPLTPQNAPELCDDLRALCERVGVRPTFLVAPFADTTGAVAFGHVRRRYVRLDAGLALLSVTDPPRFRAVVLHELAHLRNRDVDLAYLTIAVWRCFLVLAAAPMLLLAVAPKALGAGRLRVADLEPLSSLRVSAGLAALTLLILLTRNALFRARELHADAWVARWDGAGAGPALRESFARAAAGHPPRWSPRRLWAYHPTPRERVRALDDPSVLARPRRWALFGTGMVGAIGWENGRVLVMLQAADGWLNLVSFLTSVLFAAVVASAVVHGVWRAVSAAGGRRPPLRLLAQIPLLVAAGFAAGEAVALINLAGGRWALFGQYGRADSAQLATVATTVAPVVVGLVLVTAWAATAVREVGRLPGARARHRALAAVVVAAVCATAPWMHVWSLLRDRVEERVSAALGRPDGPVLSLPGTLPGWYAEVVQQLGQLTLWPRSHLFFVGSLFVPGALVGVVLLGLVPLALAARARGCAADADGPGGDADDARTAARDRRRAVGIGLAAIAACLLLIGAHLAVAGASYRAHGARSDLTAWATANLDVFLVAVTVVAAGAAAAVMLAVRRRRMAYCVLVLFASASVVAAVIWRAYPPANCAAFLGTVVDPCWEPLPARRAVPFWHYAVLLSLLGALPSALLTAAATALVRRLRRARSAAAAVPAVAASAAPAVPPLMEPSAAPAPSAAPVPSVPSAAPVPGPAGGPSPSRRPGTARRRLATAAALLGTAAVLVVTATANHRYWVVLPAAAEAATAGDCLVGTWVETRYDHRFEVRDIVIPMRRSGVVRRFHADGTAVIDFGDRTTEAGTHNGRTVAFEHTGALRLRYRLDRETIVYTSPVSAGSWVLTVDGTRVGKAHPLLLGSRERYTCTGDSLTLSEPSYTAVLRRAG
ncbi:MAG TPA: M48 family metalloprotease [Pilimelia sp.]|nr:M48 family metalloprotease [Pilimelia sp.]